MRVLIAEDEALIAMHLEMLVAQLAHEICATARSADEALAHAAMHRPHVTLMDVRLAGGSSGIDAALEMHARYGLRCIFLSGNIDNALRIAVQACDPVDFISKPILPVVLQQALEKAEASRARDAQRPDRPRI